MIRCGDRLKQVQFDFSVSKVFLTNFQASVSHYDDGTLKNVICEVIMFKNVFAQGEVYQCGRDSHLRGRLLGIQV